MLGFKLKQSTAGLTVFFRHIQRRERKNKQLFFVWERSGNFGKLGRFRQLTRVGY